MFSRNGALYFTALCTVYRILVFLSFLLVQLYANRISFHWIQLCALVVMCPAHFTLYVFVYCAVMCE